MVYEIVAKSRKEKNKSNITLTDHTSELLNQIESLKTHLQRLSVYCEEKNKKMRRITMCRGKSWSMRLRFMI